jgi:glutamate-1-semialdehyde 2,1-aminomutase
MMALRLARAATGKDRIIKFEHHFHGWHDYAAGEWTEGGTAALGVPSQTLSNVVIIPQNDLALVERTIEQESGIAAIILEPTGYHWGGGPTAVEFLRGLRELTRRTGVVLIFDEVITGFRASPGGAQARFGITPDLTTMAKIVAGGLPGGAVAGRADLLAMIDSDPLLSRSNKRRVAHPGTFNANPLSAAAAVACLELVGTGDPHRAADAAAVRLVDGMNAAFKATGVAGRAYGLASMVHFLIGQECPPGGFEWPDPYKAPPNTDPGVAIAFKQAALNEGVEFMGEGAMVSSAHTDQDIEDTANAFEKALAALKADGIV